LPDRLGGPFELGDVPEGGAGYVPILLGEPFPDPPRCRRDPEEFPLGRCLIGLPGSVYLVRGLLEALVCGHILSVSRHENVPLKVGSILLPELLIFFISRLVRAILGIGFPRKDHAMSGNIPDKINPGPRHGPCRGIEWDSFHLLDVLGARTERSGHRSYIPPDPLGD